MLKITHERPKSPTAELELEAAIEVLRWDDRMYQTSATLQLRSALTPMRLRCLVTVDAAHFHVTQTAPPDLPSRSPPAGDLNCGPPERPLHPGVKSPFPQQRRAQPRPHSGVPTTESFCESANAALTKNNKLEYLTFYTLVWFLGLFCADSPFQLRHRSFRFRDLPDVHQQPGQNIFTVSNLVKTLLCSHIQRFLLRPTRRYEGGYTSAKKRCSTSSDELSWTPGARVSASSKLGAIFPIGSR